MSTIRTFNYDLVKFLAHILQTLTSNQYTTHSCFSFINEIILFTSSQDAVMLSCDFGSLSLIFLSIRLLISFLIPFMLKLIWFGLPTITLMYLSL